MPVRIRNYAAQSDVGTMLDELARSRRVRLRTIPNEWTHSPDPFRISSFRKQGASFEALPILRMDGRTLAGSGRDQWDSSGLCGLCPECSLDDMLGGPQARAPQVYSRRVGPERWMTSGTASVGLWQLPNDLPRDVSRPVQTLDQGGAGGPRTLPGVLVPGATPSPSPRAPTPGRSPSETRSPSWSNGRLGSVDHRPARRRHELGHLERAPGLGRRRRSGRAPAVGSLGHTRRRPGRRSDRPGPTRWAEQPPWTDAMPPCGGGRGDPAAQVGPSAHGGPVACRRRRSGAAPFATADLGAHRTPAGLCAVPLSGNNGVALCRWDAAEQVTIGAAPGAGTTRIDLVVCQVRDRSALGRPDR